MERFRADRWARAGATAEELAELADEWAAKRSDEQELEGATIDGSADAMLAETLDSRRAAESAKVTPEVPPAGTESGAAASTDTAANATTTDASTKPAATTGT